MKLTTQLIYDRLRALYDVEYICSHDKNTVVTRPVFYDGGCTPGHICILPQDSVPEDLLPGAYIMTGVQSTAVTVPDAELMIIHNHISPGRMLNELQAIFDYYDAWEEALDRLIIENAGYPAIIQSSAQYLGCPMSLVDAGFSVIAIASPDADTFKDADNKVSDFIISAYITDPHFNRGLQKNGVFEFRSSEDQFLSYNIQKDGRNLGRVTLVYDEKLSKLSYTYLLGFLVSKIDIMLKISGSFLVSNESLSSLREIFAGLLAGAPIEIPYVSFKLREIGWSDENKYLLIRLQPEFRHEWQLHAPYLIPHLERLWPGACAVEQDDFVVVLLNLDVYRAHSRKNLQQEIAYFLRDGLLLAGLSRTFRGLKQLPSYYRQTELAVALGRETDPMYWCYRFDDYALLCLLKYGTINFTPEQICSPALLTLSDYDRENGTEYYKTLRTFFNNKYSYTHAAESLFIHRTTLLKRIERIVDLTGVDLDDPDVNLYIELSFRYLDKLINPSAQNYMKPEQ